MNSSAGPKKSSWFTATFIPPLVRGIIRTVTATMRVRSEGLEHLDCLEGTGQRVILAFFHGRQFLLTGFLVGRKLSVLSSLSRDGELQASVMSGLGYAVVRGSASRGGARGLIGLKRKMDEGFHATFAVDGPKGPIHEVKPGAVYLAKKMGCPIIPMTSSARPAHIFSGAWDLYLLPWPFSRGVVLFGPPMVLDGDTSDAAMARDSAMVKKTLLDLQERADEMVGRKIS
ncbi:MAG: lysophospholipid acyltransferase family protein [bacterium]|nr:lysophospholipid acyltransferase family protein [bacterium]